MFSESGSFCFMDLSSNSAAIFVSDKDLNGSMDLDDFGLLVRQTSTSTSTSEEDHKQMSSVQLEEEDKDQRDEEEKQQEGNVIGSVPVAPLKNLKLEIPSYKDEDESNEGFKTPTSSDHKIPVILECPGAPRKTKSKPAAPAKRKACRQRCVLDVSSELESLFPMPFAVDHGA